MTKKKRILLLDDEPVILNVLSDYLLAPNLEIYTCLEIEAAEAMLGAMRFDVVVTDLRVSELGGLEGMRLIRYVATHFPNTLILAMSGYVNDDVHELGRQAGVKAILEKPIDLRRLKTYIHGENYIEDEHATDEGEVLALGLIENFLQEKTIRSFLQPIVTLPPKSSDRFEAFAYEALSRAPTDTPLRNPEILFAYASRKELLFETDLLCIRAALKEGRKMDSGSKLFINTQPRSLTNPAFVKEVEKLIDEVEIEHRRIVFELTEQQTIVNPQAFAESLAELRSRGFTIALDDYGVGFANLQLVQDLKPDFLKISGYFCQGIENDPFKQMILKSTTEMAQSLGIPTILENIETQTELDIVNTLGVTYGQGYFFSKPAPWNQLKESGKLYSPIPKLN